MGECLEREKANLTHIRNMGFVPLWRKRTVLEESQQDSVRVFWGSPTEVGIYRRYLPILRRFSHFLVKEKKKPNPKMEPSAPDDADLPVVHLQQRELARNPHSLGQSGSFSIQIKWSAAKRQTVDIDLAAVVYCCEGYAQEAIYFNHPTTVDGSIRLTCGDSRDGNDGEGILVDVEKLCASHPTRYQPQKVAFIISVFTSAKTLADIADLNVSFATSRCGGDGDVSFSSAPLLMDTIESHLHDCTVMLLASLEKKGADWWLGISPAPLSGTSIITCLPSLGAALAIPFGKPARFRLPVVLSKDEQIAVRADSGMLLIGVGWDIVNGQEVDIDLSCIVVGEDGSVLDALFWGKLNLYNGALLHGGDNQTGEGEGDDEVIMCDLAALPRAVHGLYFIVSNYSSGNLRCANNIHFRLVRQSDEVETVRYDAIGAGGDYSSYVPCSLVRAADDETLQRWTLRALSLPCSGTTIHDATIRERVRAVHREGACRFKPVNLRAAQRHERAAPPGKQDVQPPPTQTRSCHAPPTVAKSQPAGSATPAPLVSPEYSNFAIFALVIVVAIILQQMYNAL